METIREYQFKTGLLYPMMVIAAIAVIMFSIIGIAQVSGWLPNGLMGRTQAAINLNEVETARNVNPFQCGECGVLESIREIEQRG